MRSMRFSLAFGVAILVGALATPSRADARWWGGPGFWGRGLGLGWAGPAFGGPSWGYGGAGFGGGWGGPGSGWAGPAGWGGLGGWGGYGGGYGGSFAYSYFDSYPAYSFSSPTMIYSIYSDPGVLKNYPLPGTNFYYTPSTTGAAPYVPSYNYYVYPAGYRWR